MRAFAIEPALDARSYPGPAWSPYLVGAGIGVLSWLTFYVSDKPIGASSFYATVAGFIGKAFAPRHTESLEYFKSNPPKLNWEFVFVLAAIGGAAVAALTGGGFVNEWVPPMWSARFGDSSLLRAAFAFGGGAVDGVRGPNGRRLHQWSRHQRDTAAQRRVMDRGDLLLHRRRRDCKPDVQDLGRCWTLARPSRNQMLRSNPPSRPHPGILAGIAFGFMFGFLLQKGGVGTYHILIGQLLFQDWTVVKIMLTAIVVGMVGIFTLHHFAKVNLHTKPTKLASEYRWRSAVWRWLWL